MNNKIHFARFCTRLSLTFLFLSLVLYLFTPGSLFARTYYVDNSNPRASDSNQGNNGRPLATISEALKRAMPGDDIQVSGGIYRETLQFVRGGQSEDNPITVLAQDGQNVHILGSEKVSGWTRSHDRIWVKQGWKVNSQQVFCNGRPLAQIGYSSPFHQMSLNGEPVLPALGTGLADMFPGSFWYDAVMGSLYVWLPDGSSPQNHLIEASVRPYIIAPNSLNHIHLKGLVFAHSNTSILGRDESMVNIRGNNWKIQNCQFLLADMGALSLEGQGHLVENSSFILNGSHGISINQLDTEGELTGQGDLRTQNITLRSNETSYNNIRDFSHNWKAGGMRALDNCRNISILEHKALDNKGAGIWFDTECRNINISRSLFKDNFAGIIADNSDEININNSVFADNIFGMGILSSSQANVQFNTFHKNHYGLTLDTGQEDRPLTYNTIMNNLFNMTAQVDLSLLVSDFNSQGNLTDFNAYGRDDHELFNEWRDNNGKLRSARSLKDFQDSTGMEQNSVLLSALWSDKSDEEDFIPPPGAPVLDAAHVDNTVEEDLDFHGRVRGKKRDIGAVEYVASLDNVEEYDGTDQTQEQEQKTDDSGSVVVEEEQFFLTVDSGTGSGQYKAGDKVVINANLPADGKEFSHWSGGTAYLEDVNTSSTTVTMPKSDVNVAATYKDKPIEYFSLTVESGSGSGQYKAGEVVNIVADEPAEGQIFSHWMGDVNYLGDANSSSTTVTMPESEVMISAVYYYEEVDKDIQDVIIDNRDAATSYTGTWEVSGGSDPYGADSVWSRDGDAFTWHFNPVQSSNYEVMMWWTEWPSRSPSVPVEIEHSGGKTRIFIDQTANGGKWNSLGDYFFEFGQSYRVTIISQPGPASTCADAVRFVSKDPTESVTIAWDDDQSPKPDGYFVYIGTQSGKYDRKIDAGNALAAVINGLSKDKTYYISVVAYGSNGEESNFSDELIVVVS